MKSLHAAKNSLDHARRPTETQRWSFFRHNGCARRAPKLDVVMHFVGRRENRGAPNRLIRRGLVLFGTGLTFLLATPLGAADLDEARQHFIKGHYEECIRLSEEAVRPYSSGEDWHVLLVQSLLAVGRYPKAQEILTRNLERDRWSVRLRLLGYEVFRQNGQPERARAMLEEINTLVPNRTRWDVPNLVALGKAALLLGVDPRQVLEQFFDRAKKLDPAYRETYLASGQLALDKNDFALAAKVYAEGLKRFPHDPDLHFGLAQAYAPSDRSEMLDSLQTALGHNTNHVPSYLLLADHLIDGEKYEAADKTLEKALAVNSWHPEAWAYRAVLKHLGGDTNGEHQARETALRFWASNPSVDHLIGEQLSQKYRFAEGAACQRQALRFDAKFLPAKIQLAQDLLRLGDETEGWNLADQVHQQDAYDVTAYNLVTLKESLAKFQTITNQHFIVRMSPREAAIYGPNVLDLLTRAKTNLCAKYELDLDRPTIVEIFPDQKDFGVRTFGLPHNPGFLGVCFGPVITANSPASQASHPANWQAVLWHEFCHVVTLQMTRNRMPRWLSEGISVYEERLANPTWGQVMNPRYREMVLGKELTPVGDLSAAFLTAKSDLHLQFAYYESSLVVEFLVTRYGLESLKKILRDLGTGTDINQAIALHTAPLDKIEKDFEDFARHLANTLAPGLDWTKPKPEELARAEPDWLKRNPTNYYLLTHQAKKWLREQNWEQAKVPLGTLVQLYPLQTGADNAYSLLAEAHRNLGETNLERGVLSRLAMLDADAVDAFLRLMELSGAMKDWSGVRQNAERFLAVNPLLAQPYRYLAQANEHLGQNQTAIQSYQTLLLLDPPDPAEAHFRLARLLHETDEPGSKRHLLQALEEAPRFREAHRLLLQISHAKKSGRDSPVRTNSDARPVK